MAPLITEGIILNRKDYRESDLIVTAFTKDFGKVAGIAFGAKRSRKRFANCLGLFAHSRLYITFPPNRDLARLDECDLLEGIRELSQERLAYASYLAELTVSLTADRDRNQDLYLLLRYCIPMIVAGSDPEETVHVFETRFLTLLGYKLNLETCERCHTRLDARETVYFNMAGGGFQCETCAKDRGTPLSGGTIKSLSFIQNEPLPTAGRLRMAAKTRMESRLLLETFLLNLTQKRFKSLEFIRKLREQRP